MQSIILWLLDKFRNRIIGAVVAGGLGFWAYSSIQAGVKEMDLTNIGRGIPSVVQVHDPNCKLCRALQKETRAALSQMDENEIQYLIADIKTEKGSKFALEHRAPHVTLILFDSNGKKIGAMSGNRKRGELLIAFNALIEHSK